MLSKKQAVIQEWGIIVDPHCNDPYIAPEALPKVLFGKVYGHERITDSHRIISSHIINIDEENETVETLNTIYHLGKKSDDYSLFLNNYNAEV